MMNGQRREADHYHNNNSNYMHNQTLTPQHLMQLGEEDDDGAILMLQGAQRSELFSFITTQGWCLLLLQNMLSAR